MNAYVGPNTMHGSALQVLTLALHGEIFALEAHHVREILDLVTVTEVPGAPRYLNGLINVRGKVVPLLDLCLKLGMPPSPPSIDTRIVVVEVVVEGQPTIVGVRADRVYEITELAANALEEAPQIGMRVPRSFVRCIGKRAGEFLVVLHLDNIMRLAAGPAGIPNRRRHTRIKLSNPCQVSIAGTSVAASLADLSEGGAALSGFPARPEADRGSIAIEGLPAELPFCVVDHRDGILRLRFEPAGNPALVAMVRRLESQLSNAA